jgi:hypothetical protein
MLGRWSLITSLTTGEGSEDTVRFVLYLEGYQKRSYSVLFFYKQGYGGHVASAEVRAHALILSNPAFL